MPKLKCMPSEKPPRDVVTVPELAARWGVDYHKVIAWIKSGELRALNLARKPNGQPRYRIKPEAIEAFESKRSTVPEPRKQRIVRRPKHVIDFI